MKKRNSTVLVIAGVLLLMFGLVDLIRKRNLESGQPVLNNLYPVGSFSHAHGLALDIDDPNKLYIATHNGLFVLVNEKELYRIGAERDDYMGFSPHPKNSGIFFTSGHPAFGGNLGFQESRDGGVTWIKVSDGVNGPVDFHAMTISPANPEIIYGWYRGLQRSNDGGKNWEVLQTDLSRVIALTAHPKDENVVFAATAQGLKQSKDKGTNWAAVEGLQNFSVFVLAIKPDNPDTMVAFAKGLGFVKTLNSGKSWSLVNENFEGQTALYIVYSKTQPETVYLLTEDNLIYKSTDGGDSWSKIR